MKIGDRAQRSRAFTNEDMAGLARLTGAPVRDGLVAEPFIHALFSDLLGMELPGPGANYLKQEIGFLGAARIGETLTARVEITRLRPDKHLVDLATTCHGGDGRLIAEGRALIYAKDVAGGV